MKACLTLAALLAALACPAGAVEICFEHAGPQDKPMPEFCVRSPGAAHSPQALRPDEATWAAVRSLVGRTAQPIPAGGPQVAGWYRLRLSPPGEIRYLPPGAMRQLVALLQTGPGLTDAQAQMLARLHARLN